MGEQEPFRPPADGGLIADNVHSLGNRGRVGPGYWERITELAQGSPAVFRTALALETSLLTTENEAALPLLRALPVSSGDAARDEIQTGKLAPLAAADAFMQVFADTKGKQPEDVSEEVVSMLEARMRLLHDSNAPTEAAHQPGSATRLGESKRIARAKAAFIKWGTIDGLSIATAAILSIGMRKPKP